MKKINVPIIKQDVGSVECGLACLAMIYGYYKKGKTLDDLRKEISLHDVGTYAPQLGSHLLKNGFEVQITTFNPLLVEREDKNLSQEKLLEKLRSPKKIQNTDSLNYFISFLESGGTLEVKIPSIEDIFTEISSNRPVIAFLTNAVLYPSNISRNLNKPLEYTFHIVVVVGVDGDKVIINDPFWGDEGGEQTYNAQDFFYAIHSSSLGDLDNGCLIKIKQRPDLKQSIVPLDLPLDS